MVALPQEMTFIAHGSGGGPEVLVPARGPVPVPKPDEVLIRTMAVGVNRPDVAQRSGSYPPPAGASPILGLECAGEVVAAGAEVKRYRIGDKVTALTNGGAYAEYCTAPEAQTLPWPDGFDALRHVGTVHADGHGADQHLVGLRHRHRTARGHEHFRPAAGAMRDEVHLLRNRNHAVYPSLPATDHAPKGSSSMRRGLRHRQPRCEL